MVSLATDATLGLTNLDDEITVDELELEGELPPWLAGSLLRTGPARWDLGKQTVNHWFDGLAMLHRFTIDGGSVSYANRFLRTKAFAGAKDGRVGYREFATDPCRSAFQRVASLFDPGFTDNANVNVARIMGKWVALTETPMAVTFDPETLETLGVTKIPATTGGLAHPHGDNGKALSMGVHMTGRPAYRLIEDDRVVGKLPVRRPAYVHSFAMTERFAVLIEHPYTVNPITIPLSNKPFIEHFEWHPEKGTRFVVFDRRSGRHVADWHGPAFFVFHTANAYEEGDDIVIDLCAYDDPGIVQALGLQRLRAGEPIPWARLERFRLRAGGAVERTRLSDEPLELPRIDYGRVNGRPHRYVWGAGAHSDFVDTIVKVDVTTGETTTWRDGYPGEPVFVGRPGREEEDDGVLLTVVLEPERAASSMVVLDAATLTELARARVPHHIPFGFHGQFSRA
ncbi:MAG: carotenoid oxygenase family protein [Actinobacteria bacterium]|nr:MAG: carotenoid oxygenase family protein [Actinomycetota bacterium]